MHGKATLHMDSTAAQGVVDRHGIPKIRRIDVNGLWLRERSGRDAVSLSKFLGTENDADLMTKHLNDKMIKKHVVRINLVFKEGRAAKAVELQALSPGVGVPQEGCVEDRFVGIFDRYAERPGGGLWQSRGAGGS